MSEKILYISDVAKLFGMPRKKDYRQLVKRIKGIEEERGVKILHRRDNNSNHWTTLGTLKKYMPEIFHADVEPEELNQQLLMLKRRVCELEDKLARLEDKIPNNKFKSMKTRPITSSDSYDNVN